MIDPRQLQELRNDTDGVQRVIHFNNAGSSLPPNVVRNTMIDYLKEEAEVGGYETHRVHFDAMESTYDLIAQLIGAKRNEIAIVENATVAWNGAFQAIPFEDRDEIITNKSDYASNYLSYMHHSKDLTVKVLPSLESGDPDVEALERYITPKTKLVSITHMPTNSGLVSPAEAIGKVCKEKGVLFLLDTCQSVGQYPIDVEKIGCDMLSTTGRKYLRAPRGTGFLYVRESVQDQLVPQWIDLHAAEWTGPESYQIRKDARKFENWEGNRAALMGLNKAVSYALNIGLENIWQRIQVLSSELRSKMSEVPTVTVRDIGSVKSGIVSFTYDGLSVLEVQNRLFKQGINISWTGAPNTYLDMTERGLSEIARASVHYYNSSEEIDVFVKALKELG